MLWEAWVLVGVLVLSMLVEIYRIDRPRKTKGLREVLVGCIEVGFYIYCVLRLAGKAA